MRNTMGIVARGRRGKKCEIVLMFMLLLMVARPWTASASELGDALNSPDLVWATDGDTYAGGWTVDTSTHHDAVASARTAATPRYGRSWLTTTVAGPGELTFWWKLSACSGDSLELYVDDFMSASIRADQPWVEARIPIDSGGHAIRWQFRRGGNCGENAGWVDEVRVIRPAQPPTISIQPRSQAAQAGSHFSLWTAASGPAPLEYQWSLNGTPIGGATNSFYFVTNLIPARAGEYVVIARNPHGSITSQPASVTLTDRRYRLRTWGRLVHGTRAAQGARYTKVAAGYGHNVALKTDGTVVAWGSNEEGQSEVPEGLTEVTEVAAGRFQSLALRAGGTVVAWGDQYESWVPKPQDLTNVIAIAAGEAHSLVLRANGQVAAWGYDYSGQCRPPADLGRVVAIAAGGDICLALQADGRVRAWGGLNSVSPAATNVVSLAAGYAHGMALRADGTVVAWGRNDSGQSTVPAGLRDVVAVGAGIDWSVALKADGTVVVWGYLFDGRMAPPANLNHVRSVSLKYSHVLALRDDGTLVGWGNNTDGQTLPPEGLHDLVGIAACDPYWGEIGHYLAVRADGTLQAFGQNDLLVQHPSDVPAGLGGVVAAAGAVTDSYALMSDGTITNWGSRCSGGCPLPPGFPPVAALVVGGYQRLGLTANGTLVSWNGPAPVGLGPLVAAAAGGNGLVGLAPDGTLRGWPVAPAVNPAEIVSVAAGRDHYLALRSDGRVYAWGDNTWHQCDVPTTLSDAVAVAAGRKHSLVLRSNGQLLGWGDGALGATRIPRELEAEKIGSIACGVDVSLALVEEVRIQMPLLKAWFDRQTRDLVISSDLPLDATWQLEKATALDSGAWMPVTTPSSSSSPLDLHLPIDSAANEFYRLRCVR